MGLINKKFSEWIFEMSTDYLSDREGSLSGYSVATASLPWRVIVGSPSFDRSFSDGGTVKVFDTAFLVSTKEPLTQKNSVHLFPNPTKDHRKIIGEQLTDIKLMDALGAVIIEPSLPQRSLDTSFTCRYLLFASNI